MRAAEGWLDLGLHEEARNEIVDLPARLAGHPHVLTLWWRIYAAIESWEEAFVAASKLVEVDPENPFGWIHRSYALHELKRTAEAAKLLTPALEKFPTEELVPYNLACYACQLGDLETARNMLKAAMTHGGRGDIKARALEDADLVPLRSYIAKM